MKVLGIVGSRRKGGNTATLLRQALEGAEKGGAATQILFLDEYQIEGCRGCEGCAKTHRCVIDDDMQRLYPLLLQADGLILGSPTYFYNVSSAMKAFIDRCYCLEAFAHEDRSCWVGVIEALGGRYSVVIVVCEQSDERYIGFAAEAMALPLSDLGYRVIEEVKITGLFGIGEAAEDHDAMSLAEKSGRRLARMIQLREDLRISLEGTHQAAGS